MDIVILGSIKQTIKPFEGIAIKEVKQTAVLTDDPLFYSCCTKKSKKVFSLLGLFSI
jgi:hypothetical protein